MPTRKAAALATGTVREGHEDELVGAALTSRKHALANGEVQLIAIIE